MENQKYSSFFTITPSVNNHNQRLVYSFLSGKLVLVSDEIGAKIDKKETNFDFEIQQILTDLGILIGSEIDELGQVVNENEYAIENVNTLNFTFFASSYCQLGCVYCGQKHEKDSITQELYPDIMKYLENELKASPKNHIFISWFGAEPMLNLHIIDDLTPQIKALAERYNCTYGARITTNGLLLNPKNFKFLMDHDVKDITVSLDGTKEYHDQRRFTKGNKPSFDVIINNLINIFNEFNIKDEGADFRLRINVDQHNCEGIIPFIDLIANLKFQNKIKRFDIAPIHAWGNDAHLRSIPAQDFANLKIDFYIKLLELGFIDHVSLPKRVRVTCQAVTSDARYMTANGNLYDCSELPLIPEVEESHKVGHIKDFVKDTHRNYADWNKDVYNKEVPCATCRVFPVCGGGCPKSWKEGHIPCPDFKYNIDDLIVLSYLNSTTKLFSKGVTAD